MKPALSVLLVLLAACGIARAETSAVSATGFVSTHQREVKAPPAVLFAALARVNQWWNPQHTQSRQPGHLSLDLAVGGCFCERWEQNSVQHGLVTYVRQHAMVRMDSSLGPLHALPVKGVLSFTITPKGDNALLDVNYRVGGSADNALERFAAPVDRVLAEQVQRLGNLVEIGRPD